MWPCLDDFCVDQVNECFVNVDVALFVSVSGISSFFLFSPLCECTRNVTAKITGQ